MYVVMGVTGQVGGATARSLLAARQPVRAVVRSAQDAARWARQGCETAIADLNHPNGLSNAFAEAEGAFVMLPPLFDPSPGFPEAKAFAGTLRSSLDAASPKRVVCLSTIGANVNRSNLLNQLGLLEAALEGLANQVTFLRPAWFMKNYGWDIPAARDKGVVPKLPSAARSEDSYGCDGRCWSSGGRAVPGKLERQAGPPLARSRS